jgi:F-type H+-transporting ATPase subunit a
MEGIGEEILNLLKSQLIDIHLFGQTIQISQSVIVTWVIMAFLIVFSIIFTRNLKAVPEGKQNFIEVVVEFVNNFTKDAIGHHWKMFAPYIGTILLFLVISNTISIFNIIPSGEELDHLFHTEAFKNIPDFKLLPPTKNASVALAFAIMSMVVVLTAGIKVRRVSGWLKSFIEPVPVMLPFKILDYFIRPISLCFRQFGNILGAAIIMELLYIAIPIILPGVLSIYFDIFDGILQAYVFCFLTSLYIAEAIE